MIFEEEKKVAKIVLQIADNWGYGNMIALLQRGWAEKLKKEGLPEKVAIEATINRTPYSLEIFNQFIKDSNPMEKNV